MDDVALLSGTPALAPGQVVLSYDDGPGPKSAELAALLGEQGVPATFFVLGESIKRYGEELHAYVEHGHTIGLHSEYHRPFTHPLIARDQLGKVRARVEHHLGRDFFAGRPIWHRPPYGVGNEPVPGYAGPVGWHAHGRDWDLTYRNDAPLRPPSNPRPVQTVAGCVAEIVERLQRTGGGIVLLHDFAPYSEFAGSGLTEADLELQAVAITALLLPRLRDAGFELTGLPEPELATEAS
ncbi:polysaccharide deacetylase family protein [Jatrophihabitans sp.]|uniref:polysaccharide deacetylase family protein n=1 Tax=Jatrophihabitans sp. TaxID=1932789 RepID=UPI002BB44571|nr:polysaccharide deacetylase family protein [Jatrophihabitans sp.]